MKAEFAGFVKQVGIALAGTAALGAYPLYAYGNAEVVWAAAAGCAICTVNVLGGCFAGVWSFDKPQVVFQKVLFGGMLIRMAAIGLVFFLLIKFTDLHRSSLTLSLFLCYILFHVLEIRFLVRHLSSRRGP